MTTQLTTMENKIEIKDLSFGYNELLFQNINLNLNKSTTIIGPSGCGKSTLLRILCGIIPTDNITISDCFSVVFQKNTLFPWKTVEQNLRLVSKNDKKIDQALKSVGLEEKRKSYLKDLSGGQIQRANIARALCSDAKIIFCDEPTSSLDYFTKQAINYLIIELIESNGIQFIWITHDLEETILLGEQILIIDDEIKLLDNPYMGQKEMVDSPEFNNFKHKLRGMLL